MRDLTTESWRSVPTRASTSRSRRCAGAAASPAACCGCRPRATLALPVLPGTHVVVAGEADPRRHGRQRRAAPARRRAGRHPRRRQAARHRRRSRSGWPRAESTPSCGTIQRFDHAGRHARRRTVDGQGGADRAPPPRAPSWSPRTSAARAGRAVVSPPILAAVAGGGGAALAARRRARSPGDEMPFAALPDGGATRSRPPPRSGAPRPDDWTDHRPARRRGDADRPTRKPEWVTVRPRRRSRPRSEESATMPPRAPSRKATMDPCPLRTRRDLAGAFGIGVVVAASAPALPPPSRRSGGRRPIRERKSTRPVRRVRGAAADDRRVGRGPGRRPLRRDAARRSARRSCSRSRVKDVRFQLAFHNGKAAIRYMTVAAREGR